MPTILTHPAIALGLRPWLRDLPPRVLAAGAVVTVLPDADVAGLRLGIPYGSTFGHRGFTHSIVFALIASGAATAMLDRSRRTFLFLFACAMSHGLLDACTDGGRGIAFFSPFSNSRYFLPWRPIRVSPIGALSGAVLRSELRWVWLPCIVAAAAGLIAARGWRRGTSRTPSPASRPR